MEATGKGLIDFLGFAAERGLMNGNTAGGLKAASREVLSAVEGDGWSSVDLRTIDPHDFAARFERLRIGKLKPESLLVYKSRFRNAVQMYFTYLENPSGWRYKAERPASARSKPGPPTAAPGGPESQRTASGDSSTGAASAGSRASTIDYPFPLRPGLVVTLRLPVDLTKLESLRLAAFIDSLAVEDSNA
jgi:hypothetical protein